MICEEYIVFYGLFNLFWEVDSVRNFVFRNLVGRVLNVVFIGVNMVKGLFRIIVEVILIMNYNYM